MALPPMEKEEESSPHEYYMRLDDGLGYTEQRVELDHPDPLSLPPAPPHHHPEHRSADEEARTAGLDDEWEEGVQIEEATADHSWSAQFDPDLDGTSKRSPLSEEHVDLIKATMATIQITPPPWVRKMQQLQRIQQMQMQMQEATCTEGAPKGPLVLPDGAKAVSLAVAEEAWANHLQQRMPGGDLPPEPCTR